jgi:3-hydroxyisobutyrate dehydrogenase-like beta-hydroxyacid dehydrogenase
MSDKPEVIGFVGLGQMGHPMAMHIAGGGMPVICFDTADVEPPEGATKAASLVEVVAGADTVFLSLPDGKIVDAVTREIAVAETRRASVVVDLSTIGPEAAKAAAATLKDVGITYVDAPVSGGRQGALKASITLMWAGPKTVLEHHRHIADMFCKNTFFVGEDPGQGQAVKLLNNFLSGTAMAATSEAVLFGLSQGVDMKTILDVVNVSTGQNTAVSDKFPNRVLPGTFDAGFFAELLNKDVQLYRKFAAEAGTPNAMGNQVADIWQQVENALEPRSDFTLVYEVMRQTLSPDLQAQAEAGRKRGAATG